MFFLESDDEDEESLPAGFVPDPIIEPKVCCVYHYCLCFSLFSYSLDSSGKMLLSIQYAISILYCILCSLILYWISATGFRGFY